MVKGITGEDLQFVANTGEVEENEDDISNEGQTIETSNGNTNNAPPVYTMTTIQLSSFQTQNHAQSTLAASRRKQSRPKQAPINDFD